MQIVGNLIDNAFNYTLAGGNIVIELKKDPEQSKNVLFVVQDDGVGIPESFKSKVWDRFERYEDHALEMDLPGTGLGLAIVQDFIKMHHGKVWFTSKEGEGSTFFVSLPIEYRRTT
jgi:two-component system sensor histidine kinase VicK